MKKLQLEDLAKKLGYSKTLISMVLNGKGDHYGVSKKTQALVLEAIAKLDYTPNRFAKSLRTGKSHFAGLIVSDISNPFYATIAKKIESVLYERGYNLMVCSTEEDEEREKKMVEVMLQQQAVDGLIIASSLKTAAFYQGSKFGKVPIVFIDRVIAKHSGHFIVTDNFGGSEDIVRHLIKEGCRHIVCLAITPLHLSTITERIDGYRSALATAKVRMKETVKTLQFDSLEEDINEHLRTFLQKKSLPDAFFCLNNNIAVTLLMALRKKEFRKLGTAMVASFDDLAIFDLLDKKVVSVSQPVEDIGRHASELLIKLAMGKTIEPARTVLPTRLVTR